jgi:metal-sulfur cluster biosynthetic enzyme
MSVSIAEESIYAALRQVHDPELFINVVDLGLIYEVRVTESEGKSDIYVKMTMTTPACPAGPELIGEVKEVLKALEEVGQVQVEVVISPPWSPERMTDEARDELGMY